MEKQKLIKIVKEAVEEVTGQDCNETDHEKSLLDLGMDSIDIIDLQCLLERKLHMSIPDEAMGGSRQLKEVINYLEHNS